MLGGALAHISMTKIILFGIFIGLLNSVSAQELLNRVDEKGLKQGTWLTMYPNSDQIEWRYNYKDDQLDSIQISYHKNGKIKSRQLYKEGEQNGLFETYYKNGQLKEQFLLRTENLKVSINSTGNRVLYFAP
jgi:hypothetical protein